MGSDIISFGDRFCKDCGTLLQDTSTYTRCYCTTCNKEVIMSIDIGDVTVDFHYDQLFIFDYPIYDTNQLDQLIKDLSEAKTLLGW